MSLLSKALAIRQAIGAANLSGPGLDAADTRESIQSSRPRPHASGGQWDGGDWSAHFCERAAILEYDGSWPRTEAEALAFEACVVEWLTRHPVRSPTGCCHWCGRDGTGEALVAYGLDPDLTWLHGRCWSDWYTSRRAEATAALEALGITSQDGGTNEIWH